HAAQSRDRRWVGAAVALPVAVLLLLAGNVFKPLADYLAILGGNIIGASHGARHGGQQECRLDKNADPAFHDYDPSVFHGASSIDAATGVNALEAAGVHWGA